MNGQVDLHIHSDRSSDGDFSPFQIVQLAKEKNFRAIAISDHDTVAAYPEALDYGEEAGLEVIPSIELTTIFEDREFHLLLPFVEWRKKIVSDIVAEVSKRRMKEAQDRVQKLRGIGFEVKWKDVMDKSGNLPPLGVTIAQVLLEKAEETGSPNLQKYLEPSNRIFAPYLFYRDYFMEGKPASVPRNNLKLIDVLDLAPKTGGVPVLSHPGAYFQRVTREDLILLKGRGLKGIEVYSSYHDETQVKKYQKLAQELNLVPTAGSDFHGTIKPNVPFGCIKNGGYWMVEELLRRRS